MKRKIFISVILSFVAMTVTAQTNHYPGVTGTITRSGYTYKYQNDKIADLETPDAVKIYNAANPYLNTEWQYKDGREIPAEILLGKQDVNDISDSSLTILETYALVDACFTPEQKNALRGKSMFITLRFNPDTGRIGDVYFSFRRNSPFMNIPIETYRSVELALKQNLTVTVTAYGRTLTYIILFWSQKF